MICTSGNLEYVCLTLGVNPTHLYDIASKSLEKHKPISDSSVNEFVVVEIIKRKLSAVDKEEAATFRDLHRKLKTHVSWLFNSKTVFALNCFKLKFELLPFIHV